MMKLLEEAKRKREEKDIFVATLTRITLENKARHAPISPPPSDTQVRLSASSTPEHSSRGWVCLPSPHVPPITNR